MPGTLIGAFFVDWMGPKWTLVSSLLFPGPLRSHLVVPQIVGLVLQAIVGFIMSGLYKQ